VHSDLRSRKKSLPVVFALASDTAAGRELAALYRGRGPLPDEALPRAARLVEMAGGRAWSKAKSGELLAMALDQLDTVDHGPAATELIALARLVTRRDR
jgi:geranylgeranyl diphosphate synthase type I